VLSLTYPQIACTSHLSNYLLLVRNFIFKSETHRITILITKVLQFFFSALLIFKKLSHIYFLDSSFKNASCKPISKDLKSFDFNQLRISRIQSNFSFNSNNTFLNFAIQSSTHTSRTYNLCKGFDAQHFLYVLQNNSICVSLLTFTILCN